jgi:hypothetical protein
MTDIVDRLHVILDKYRHRYKRVGWQPVVEDAICEIRRLRAWLAEHEAASAPLRHFMRTGSMPDADDRHR